MITFPLACIIDFSDARSTSFQFSDKEENCSFLGEIYRRSICYPKAHVQDNTDCFPSNVWDCLHRYTVEQSVQAMFLCHQVSRKNVSSTRNDQLKAVSWSQLMQKLLVNATRNVPLVNSVTNKNLDSMQEAPSGTSMDPHVEWKRLIVSSPSLTHNLPLALWVCLQHLPQSTDNLEDLTLTYERVAYILTREFLSLYSSPLLRSSFICE